MMTKTAHARPRLKKDRRYAVHSLYTIATSPLLLLLRLPFLHYMIAHINPVLLCIIFVRS